MVPADAIDQLARSFRRRAVHDFSIEPRQVVLDIVEAARIGAKRGDVRAAAAVAEQLDAHPQVAPDEAPHSRRRVLDQHGEQATPLALGRPRRQPRVIRELRRRPLPCGAWHVRAQRVAGQRRDVASEGVRVPGGRRGRPRRLRFVGGGEPDDEARAGRDRRFGVETMPDGRRAGAVEEPRTQAVGGDGVARGAAAPREIPDRQRQQGLGAVAQGISWRSCQAMSERRFRGRRSDGIDLAEGQSRRLPLSHGEGRRVAPPGHAHGDAVGVEPRQRVGIACIGECERFREPGSLRVEPTQPRLTVAKPRQHGKASIGVRGKSNRTLANGPGHRVQQAQRRRAAVLGVRTEHTGRIVVARRRGERHRHAGQPCEAAGAFEYPHAAAVRLEPPGRKSLEPYRLVGPAARAGRGGAPDRRAPHTARRSVRRRDPSGPRAAAAAVRRQAGGCARRWRRRCRSIGQPRRGCRPHAGSLQVRCWPRRTR